MVEIVGEDINVLKNVTCRNCGSILRYRNSEIQRKDNGRDYGGGFDGYTYVVCPKCGSHAKISVW